MKKTIFFALALIGFFGLKAQSPAVEVSIDGTTAFTITAQFTMNETCTHYAICTAPTGEMGQWASNFGMTMEQLVTAWGIDFQSDTAYTWTGMAPATDYEVFVVAMSATDTAEATVTIATTASLGGEGTSVITIELSEITTNSVRMITTPNDQTALYYNGLVTADLFNEVGADSCMSILKLSPYTLYDVDDWIWEDLESGSEFYALAQGQNINGEWGEIAVASFTTLDEAGLNSVANVSNITLYPNPAACSTTLQNLEEGSLITLTDIQGRELQTFVANSTTANIDLSQTPCGVYFVKILLPNEQTIIQKLIVNE